MTCRRAERAIALCTGRDSTNVLEAATGIEPVEIEEATVKCVVCRNGETHVGTTTVTFHRECRTVVMTDVPAEVCENCGEAYVAEDVTTRLLEIAANARDRVQPSWYAIPSPLLRSAFRGTVEAWLRPVRHDGDAPAPVEGAW